MFDKKKKEGNYVDDILGNCNKPNIWFIDHVDKNLGLISLTVDL